MDDGHIYIHTVVTHKKHNSNLQSRVLQDRRGRGGLRTTVEDRQCLITAEHDGEGNIRK